MKLVHTEFPFFQFLGAMFLGLTLLSVGRAQSILYETYTDRGKVAFEKGDFDSAEKLFKSALYEAEKLCDKELIATSSVNLGKIYQYRGQYDNAEKLYLRAIETFDSLDGEDGERSAFALNNLGLLYAEQKKYEKAEEILRRTISIRERILGSDAPDLAVTLLNLGKLYADRSKFTEADAVYVRSLQILMQHQEMIEEILTCLHNMALSTYELKNFKRTEAVYKMSIAIIEKKFGGNSQRLIEPLENYAGLLKSEKRLVEARTVEKRLAGIKGPK